MASAAVTREYERLREEIAKLEARIEKRAGDLIREKQRKERQLKALREYLELSGASVRAEAQDSRSHSTGAAKLALDAAVEVLATVGQPLHYTDLYERVVERGFRIPGEKPEANLLTHLNRDRRFTRVRPGTYALRNAGQPALALTNGVRADMPTTGQ